LSTHTHRHTHTQVHTCTHKQSPPTRNNFYVPSEELNRQHIHNTNTIQTPVATTKLQNEVNLGQPTQHKSNRVGHQWSLRHLLSATSRHNSTVHTHILKQSFNSLTLNLFHFIVHDLINTATRILTKLYNSHFSILSIITAVYNPFYALYTTGLKVTLCRRNTLPHYRCNIC